MTTLQAEEPKPARLRLFKFLGVAFFVSVAAAIIVGRLGAYPIPKSIANRYSGLAYLFLYLFFLGSTIYRLRACYHLAPTLEQKQGILRILVWPFLLSVFTFIHFSEAILTDSRYWNNFWADFGPLFAYSAFLNLIEPLLKSSVLKPAEKLGPDLSVDPQAWQTTESEGSPELRSTQFHDQIDR